MLVNLVLIILAIAMAQFLRRHRLPRRLDTAAEDGNDENSNEAANNHASEFDSYEPTPIDIVVVRIMLARSKRLPPDLVDSIFDFAEYWAHSTTQIKGYFRISGGNKDREDRFLLRSFPLGLTNLGGEEDNNTGDGAYPTTLPTPLPQGRELDPKLFAKLAKYPIPVLASPARKVVFTIRSQDQGWASSGEVVKGSYKTSWTWFEAGLEKFDADHVCIENGQIPVTHNAPLLVSGLRPLHPKIEQKYPDQGQYSYDHALLHQDEWEIHRNRAALAQWQDHIVTWSYRDSIDPDSKGGQALEEQGRGRATGNGEFLRSLKLGDVITIWGKARFGGWTNRVESVRVDVYWAV